MHDLDLAAIETSGLGKRFGGKTAVAGVDLTVPRGSVYAVLGPNGAGKTTLVRMLATLLRPDMGSARVFGHDVVAHATEVRSLIGLTGQYASVDEDLTAMENLMIFGRLLGRSRADARARACALLEAFALTESASATVTTFSGGMRRRLDLAASLVSQPPLIFLDEPTTGLDPRTRVQMWETVRALVDDGATVLLTTQYLEEADQLADRIAVVDRGMMVAEGTADELKSSVGSASLLLTITDPADHAVAAGVIGRHTSTIVTTTAVPGGRGAGNRSTSLSVPIDDTALVGTILVALSAAGVEVAEMSVARPSLDDVFFALTARPGHPVSSGSVDTAEDAA
ncbi:ATP-binding cassette domain-containing protein [Williamsia sp. MIQD14]|uniref:ATP-binding cassette domain-containing protein n=1 Tax=Williamsia sp. MIQD14 TaxID=3425703 RepID=UPI003DA1C7AF